MLEFSIQSNPINQIEIIDGKIGPVGPTGPMGPQGYQGIQGERGEKGDRGEKGEPGERGIQGSQGVQGAKGDRGEKGERGERGIQGEQGPQGIQGIQGDKGEPGLPSRDGSAFFTMNHAQPSNVFNVNATDWEVAFANNTANVIDVTDDYPKGDHSVKITTKGLASFAGISQKVPFPELDLTNKIGRVFVKVSDWSKLNYFRLIAQNKNQLPAVQLDNLSSRVKHNGEWLPLYFSFPADNIIGSATDFSKATKLFFKIKDTGSPVEVSVGGEVEFFDAPKRGSVSIVFDDGHVTVLEAEKIMSKYGLTGSIAIIRQYVDSSSPNWLDHQQLKSLVDKDWEVITHGSNITGMNDEQRLAEIKEARDWCIQNGYSKWGHYVYPNGFINNRLVRDLREQGYVSARSINRRGQSIEAFDQYRINSLSVSKNDSLDKVITMINKSIASGCHLVLTFHQIVDQVTEDTQYLKTNLEAICQHIINNKIKVIRYSSFASGVATPDMSSYVQQPLSQQIRATTAGLEVFNGTSWELVVPASTFAGYR